MRSPDRANHCRDQLSAPAELHHPDFVHVLQDGRIVRSGGKELAFTSKKKLRLDRSRASVDVVRSTHANVTSRRTRKAVSPQVAHYTAEFIVPSRTPRRSRDGSRRRAKAQLANSNGLVFRPPGSSSGAYERRTDCRADVQRAPLTKDGAGTVDKNRLPRSARPQGRRVRQRSVRVRSCPESTDCRKGSKSSASKRRWPRTGACGTVLSKLS